MNVFIFFPFPFRKTVYNRIFFKTHSNHLALSFAFKITRVSSAESFPAESKILLIMQRGGGDFTGGGILGSVPREVA